MNTKELQDKVNLKKEIANRFKGNKDAALILYLGEVIDFDKFVEKWPDIAKENDNIYEMLEDLFNLFQVGGTFKDYEIKVRLPSWMYCGE